MVLQVVSPNDVKVYHVTAGKAVPEWLAAKNKKALRYDQGAGASKRIGEARSKRPSRAMPERRRRWWQAVGGRTPRPLTVRTYARVSGRCAPTEWRSRVELLQDFEFPGATTHLRYTPDRTHLVATGPFVACRSRAPGLRCSPDRPGEAAPGLRDAPQASTSRACAATISPSSR